MKNSLLIVGSLCDSLFNFQSLASNVKQSLVVKAIVTYPDYKEVPIFSDLETLVVLSVFKRKNQNSLSVKKGYSGFCAFIFVCVYENIKALYQRTV